MERITLLVSLDLAPQMRSAGGTNTGTLTNVYGQDKLIIVYGMMKPKTSIRPAKGRQREDHPDR
jgi:hypothetical protein